MQERDGHVFEPIDPQLYQFKSISDTWYPIPVVHYASPKKHNVLGEYLISLFREHGVGKRAYQGLGYIPNDMVNAILARGDLFTENRFGEGLFHGNYSHTLQIAILILALKSGDISATQTINNQQTTFTLLEILNALAYMPSRESNSAFAVICDTFETNEISLNYPEQVGSIIMHLGHLIGIPVLANVMIDSFCKGFLAYRLQLGNILGREISMPDFFKYVSDLQLSTFNIFIPFIKTNINRATEKQRPVYREENKDYALVEKTHSLTLFKSKRPLSGTAQNPASEIASKLTI